MKPYFFFVFLIVTAPLACASLDEDYPRLLSSYPEFAAQEKDLSDGYAGLLARGSPGGIDALRKQQREWLSKRATGYETLVNEETAEESIVEYLIEAGVSRLGDLTEQVSKDTAALVATVPSPSVSFREAAPPVEGVITANAALAAPLIPAPEESLLGKIPKKVQEPSRGNKTLTFTVF